MKTRSYLRYFYAILAMPLIVLLRFALLPLIGTGTPYVTLFPVSVAVAMLAGLGPAILTGILGSLAIDYFFIPPLYAIEFDIPSISRVAVVVLTSAFVGYVGGMLRAARAKAEEQTRQLLESQQDLNRAQTVAHIGSWRLDIRRNELTWSDEVYRMFSIPKGTPMTYETFLSTVHPDDREYVDKKWKAALTGENYDIEHRIVVDDKIKWVRERAELEFDKDGTLLSGFGTVTDITQRKRAESIIQARLRMLTVANISVKSLDEMIQTVLDEIESLTGSVISFYHFLEADQETLSLQSWSTNTVRNMCSAEGRGTHYPVSQAGVWVDCVRERHPVIHNDYASLPHRKGMPPGHAPVIRELVVPVLRGSRIVAIIGVGNKPTDYDDTDVEIVSHLGDLSWEMVERKRAEEVVLVSELRYRRLFEVARDGILILDADSGRIVDVNPFIKDMLGYSQGELLDKKLWEIGLFKNIAASKESFLELQTKGYIRYENLPLETKDGRHIAVEFVSNVYLVDHEKVIQCNIRDITDRVQAEEMVRQARDDLEKANSLLQVEIIHRKQISDDLERSNKDLEQFAYVASHDLQEPLRAVAGFVELLKRNLQSSLDAGTTEYMNFTVDGARRMQTLISGLLEYSRVGTQGKKPEQTDSKAALDQAIARLQTGIKESGAKIAADDLPTVYFDDAQLAQLFQNLIGNAIKFRGEQAPRIHIGATRQDGGWQFAVADNGIGIEPQYTERIFLIFQRLHSRGKYPGTGIGLSICKKIVERHGGKIWVESTSGSGSTFYFTIPDKGGLTG